MSLKQANHPALSEEGLARELRRLRGRFLLVNAGRLDRAMQAMSARQQRIVRLLPLLFHVNYPLFPGYVSKQTPAGVSGFMPDEAVFEEARSLHREFVYRPGIFQLEAEPFLWKIQGLFLMGSLGTLAQGKQSDLDVWVCHDPNLNAEQLEELRLKCDRLTAWAAEQGVEAYFFLINPEQFAQGKRSDVLDAENCGTSQHFLLLDEFYRTAILLGGRPLMWWLVPPSEEGRYREYVASLQSRGLLAPEEVLDLGHLGDIPPGEFLGAGLWQLYKAISSPYKAILKLLLTEVYASEYPQVECLALTFKHAVFSNCIDLDELDPYLLIYRRLERYLGKRGEPERLELVRRSLYHKVNRKLAQLSTQTTIIWQYRLLQRLVDEWDWDIRQIDFLDARAHWKVAEVSRERRLLVSELTLSFRSLTQFARRYGVATPMNSRDLAILGRKLYAAFERKAGKIEFINPGISGDISEPSLTLVCARDESDAVRWTLHRGCLPAGSFPDYTRIKRACELATLLAWCHRNGIVRDTTHLTLHAGCRELTDTHLAAILRALAETFPMPPAPLSEQALQSPSVPRQALLLVNVGRNRPPRDGADPVVTLDLLVMNSWNELMVTHYAGDDAVVECLRDYLDYQLQGAALSELKVNCPGRQVHGDRIQRLEKLFAEACRHLLSHPGARYLLRTAGGGFHLLEMTREQLEVQALASRAELLLYLEQPRRNWGPLRVDQQALAGHELELILPLGRPGLLQVFYLIRDEQAELMVLDEYNSVWCRIQPFRDEQSLLNPLWRFLHSTLRRHADERGPEIQAVFYQIVPDPQAAGSMHLEWRTPPQAMLDSHFYDVEATILSDTAEGLQVSLSCNHRRFSHQEYGDDLYRAVAAHILRRRRGQERYPCYLTGLDMSRLEVEGHIQTVQYLHYKSLIEQALNEALCQVEP